MAHIGPPLPQPRPRFKHSFQSEISVTNMAAFRPPFHGWGHPPTNRTTLDTVNCDSPTHGLYDTAARFGAQQGGGQEQHRRPAYVQLRYAALETRLGSRCCSYKSAIRESRSSLIPYKDEPERLLSRACFRSGFGRCSIMSMMDRIGGAGNVRLALRLGFSGAAVCWAE